MAGVQVLKEDDCWVVACFDTRCPEHGIACSLPWLDDHDTERKAKNQAGQHLQWINDYWKPDVCGSCGQRVPKHEADR